MKETDTERTLVLIKPDAMEREISNIILSRFGPSGLNFNVVADDIFQPDKERIIRHYDKGKKWLRQVGLLATTEMSDEGHDAFDFFDVNSGIEVGQLIHDWLVEFMISGPIRAVVYEGTNGIRLARKLVGHTLPFKSAPGTIRGDFATRKCTFC